ncbi:periplasmic binding protein-like I [Chytriomyces cf. hyalinus JEL632]|nr:periplasmic binding protein-like I [Chytriomyces cf. hyalinus JEL632]
MINITLGILSNYCAFKNMVFNGSYATNFSQIFDPDVVDMDGNSGWTYYSDLAMIVAVDQVNRNPSILPGVHVNLKRFSDCGSVFDPSANLEYYGNSAGYASAVTANDILNVHTDVIGVIGNQYSTTARGINEILSDNKIPVCMACTGSPRYTDKNKYPYVFRTRPNFHVPSMLLLLKQWNVRRVAIIYQSDNEFGISAWVEMKKSFHRERISVLTSVGVEGNFDNAAIEYARLSLKQSDARYIILSGNNFFNSYLLRALASKGIYGPKYVWMSYNAPRSRNALAEYQEGFIMADADPLDASEDLWKITNEMAHYEFDVGDVVGYSLPGFVDCVMLMLLGFSKVGKARPDILQRRGYQDQMNFTLFQNLSYHGLSAPGLLTLDSNGDRQGPVTFSRMKNNSTTTYPFARSAEDVEQMTYYNYTAKIFNGDSATPPSDGSVDIIFHVYNWESAEGIVLAATSVFGVLESFVCVGFLVRYRRNKLVMATSPVDTIVLCIGCMILFSTGFGYIGTLTAQKCRTRVLLQVTGASLILGPMIVKNGMVVWLFRQDTRREKAVIDGAWRRVRFASCLVPVLSVSLACVWGARARLEPVRFAKDGVLYDRCRVPANAEAAFLNAATALLFVMWLLLVGTAYFTAKIQIQEFNETSQIILIAFSSLVPFCLVQMISQSPDANTDFKVYIVVFIFVAVILATMVGSRALDVYRSQLSRPTDVKKESGRLRRSSKAIIEGARPSVRQSGGKPTKNVSSYGFAKLSKTTERCTFCVRTSYTGYLSKWMLGMPSVHMLGDRKVWLTLSSPLKDDCFPITDTFGFVQEGSMLQLDLKPFGVNSSLVIEFGSAGKAAAFVEELGAAVNEMQRSKPGTNSFLQNASTEK